MRGRVKLESHQLHASAPITSHTEAPITPVVHVGMFHEVQSINSICQ